MGEPRSSSTATWAGWRFAGRLARREVRRRPGRTILVITLVAIPMCAMTMASVLAHTSHEGRNDPGWTRDTDLVVHQVGIDTPVSLSLPDDSSALTFLHSGWVPVETTTGRTVNGVWLIGATETPLDRHPGAVSGTEKAPKPGEIWLSRDLAGELGVATGDEISLAYPSGTWTVSGTGQYEGRHGEAIAVFGDLPAEEFLSGVLEAITLVNLPAGTTREEQSSVVRSVQDQLGQDSGAGCNCWVDRVQQGPGLRGEQLAWGWVAGAIATAAMGIIIAAAFATSARRQVTTLGILAANGAPEVLTRRALSLQGFWTGLAGSVVGITVGMAGLLIGRSTIEGFSVSVRGGYQVALVDLVIIMATGTAVATIAAGIPARSAARIPVLSALAGRRPIAAVPPKLVPAGVLLFAFGVFMLVLAAGARSANNATAAAAVVGGLLVLAGTCCASPLAIDRMSRASATVGGSWRFAGRSLARTRTRSAAVVTAIAVTGAVAMSGSALALDIDDGGNPQSLPRDAVLLDSTILETTATEPPLDESQAMDPEPLTDQPLDEDVQRRISAVLPDAEWVDLRRATWDERAFDPNGEWPAVSADEGIVIADPAIIDLYELSTEDHRRLRETGALVLQPWFLPADAEEKTAVQLRPVGGDILIDAAPRENLAARFADGDSYTDGILGVHNLMITEEAARDAGLEIVTRGAIARTGRPLTNAERNAIEDIVSGGVHLGDFYRGAATESDSLRWSLTMEYTPSKLPAWLVQAGLIAAALVLTLLVVAIGLALATAEGKDEQDVLVAVGARPGTLRSMAGAKAVVLTLTGIALAVPAGVIPLLAVLRTLDATFHMPWVALALLVAVVPVVAGLCAWTVSSVAQRFRPVQMSSFAAD